MNFIITVDIIIDAIFFGFCVFSVIFYLTPIRKMNFNRLDKTATVVFQLSSLVGLLLVLDEIFGNNYDLHGFIGRFTGVYAVWYILLYTFMYVIPHLFWWKKIRTSRVYRIIFSLIFLFAVNFENFVILITSMHRDYLPSNWQSYSYNYTGIMVLNWLIELLIFAMVISIVYFGVGLVRRVKVKS